MSAQEYAERVLVWWTVLCLLATAGWIALCRLERHSRARAAARRIVDLAEWERELERPYDWHQDGI